MKKLQKYFKEDNGFTLVEMSIVLLVIAVLLIIMVPNVSDVMTNVNKTTDPAIITTVETQIEIYESRESTELTDLSILAAEGYITEEQLEAYNKAIENKGTTE